MSSIRSTLIRSSIAKIQGELEQLENWLHRDYSTAPTLVPSTSVAPTPVAPTPVPSTPIATVTASVDGTIIYHAIQQLSKQLDSQQHTLNHMIDRLDILEGTRNIHIEDPWLDADVTQLQNEIIDNDLDEYDTVINVNKSEEPMGEEKNVTESVAVVEIQENVHEEVQEKVQENVQEKVHEEVQENVHEEVQENVHEEVHEEVQENVHEEVHEEEVHEEEVQEEEVQEEEVQEEEEVHEEEVQEEEEEVQEEEDGMEYEEVEFKGETFYRDTDQFIYRMNEEGQLSEDPIGYWKVKSQTIAFYQK